MSRVPLDVVAFCTAALALSFGAGAAVGVKYHQAIRIGLVDPVLTAFSEAKAHPLTIPQQHDGAFGLTVLDDRGREGHLLVSGYLMDVERVEVRLIDLASGETLKVWHPDPEEIRARATISLRAAKRFEPQAPYPTGDGELVFMDNPGPLVKIDACSEILWITEGKQHHSLERDLKGNFIAAGDGPSLPPPFQHLQNDSVSRFSAEGERIDSRSVAEILVANGLGPLLTTLYPKDRDAVHLNDVEVAPFDGPFWKTGDWGMSLRKLNLVLIYRPSTGKIVWYRVGPWQKQHDVEFQPDGRLSVFGNDVVDFPEGRDFPTGHSDIYVVQPDGSVTTPFTEAMAAARVRTQTQGVLDLLPGGDAFVEETDIGRLSRIGTDGLVWTFNNAVDGRAGVLNWSRYFPEGALPPNAALPCPDG